MAAGELLVVVGAHVAVELISKDGIDDLELEIVPDQRADFAHGFLGEGTPLARAILGKTAGEVVPYQVGDIQAVRIIRVAPGEEMPDNEVQSRRQEAMRKAVEQAERTNAMIFASSYSGKWGDYDPGGVDLWEKAGEEDPDKSKQ